jgi:type IV secretion system protein VirD4
LTDHRDHHGLELALAAVLGALAAFGALVWSATGLAAVLSGTGWPRLSASAVASALMRLPTHLSDPRLAWPSAVRAQIPGPAAFYPAVALVLAGLAAAIAGLLRLRIAQLLGGAERGGRLGARWGTAGDLAALRRRPRAPRLRGSRREREQPRLALGYRGMRLLRAEARHALVAFGPPQSGKSAGIAIPSLLEWSGPAIGSSIKTDLYAATVRRREALGAVMGFDPYGLSPARSSTWSPLRAARGWDGALSTALRMTAAAELDTGDVKGGSYWAAAAEQRLAPLLWAAANTGGGIAAVVRWAYGHGDAELSAILARLADQASDARAAADAQAADDAHAAFEHLAGDTRSSIESTVQMLLRAYRSPRVQASAISCQITPQRLLDGCNTLYLIGDSHRSKLLRPLFLTLLQELVDHAYQQATLHGGQLHQPLLLCLDELGNVAPLPNLAEIASTAPSHNIQLVSVFHDVAQARGRYGVQAHTVINSHRARMLLPGVGDLETLRYFSDLLGEQHIRQRPGGTQDRRPERRPLAAPEQLRQLCDGEALLIYGRLAPTKLRLRLHYRDRQLRKLARPGGQR